MNERSNDGPGSRGTLPGTLGEAEEKDRRIAHRMAAHRHRPAVRWLGWASEIADQPQLAALCAGVALTGLARGDARLAGTGARMLLAHGLATLAKSCIKRAVNRTRPRVAIEEDRYEMRPGSSGDGDDQSFPSGHTAGASAAALVVAIRHPPMAVPAAILAAGASLIQVPRGKHYPGDVLAGLAIGALGAAIALSLRGRPRP